MAKGKKIEKKQKTIMLWDVRRGNEVLGPLARHTDSVSCVAFSPDGGRIAIGSWDNTISLWDAVKGKVAGPFIGHTGTIYSVGFSPDGKWITSGSYDKTVCVWDAQSGEILVGPLTGHTDIINSVTFSMDGQILASGSSDHTVKVWSAESGRLIHEPPSKHTTSVYLVAFSPNGEKVVSADWKGNVCVWDTGTGALVSGPLKRHAEGTLTTVFMSSSTYYCAISPNGKWIAGCKREDRTIVEVWDSETGHLAVTFSDHTDKVRSVLFSPDSKRILSASDDKTIRVHTLDCLDIEYSHIDHPPRDI